jgi:hypothetical protein
LLFILDAYHFPRSLSQDLADITLAVQRAVHRNSLMSAAAWQFRVRLDNGHNVIAHIAGKMLKNFIRSCPATQ